MVDDPERGLRSDEVLEQGLGQAADGHGDEFGVTFVDVRGRLAGCTGTPELVGDDRDEGIWRGKGFFGGDAPARYCRCREYVEHDDFFPALLVQLMPGVELDDEEFALALATTSFRPGLPWDRRFTDEQLALITVPTLVHFGAETVVNDVDKAADRARLHIRSVEVEIFPGVGHDLLWANPEQIIPRYLTFVAAHDEIFT